MLYAVLLLVIFNALFYRHATASSQKFSARGVQQHQHKLFARGRA